jgi:hypothetical protein
MTRSERVEAAIAEIRRFYDFGRSIGLKRYGRGPDDEAKNRGVCTDMLRKARRLCVLFDPAEIDALCSAIRTEQANQKEASPIFSRSHLVRLLSVPMTKERAILQRRAIKEAWSTADLETEIALRYERRRAGGRPPRTGRDVRTNLTLTEARCESWRRWHEALLSTDRRREARTKLDDLPVGVQKALSAVNAACLRLQRELDAVLQEHRSADIKSSLHAH